MIERRAVVVLGMHRSGTSSIAGALARLGAGLPQTLMPAGGDNPKGFFESRLIGELNDRILQAAGSSWSDWRRFDIGNLLPGTLESIHSEIHQTIQFEFGGTDLIVLKDPRLCRLYPVWDGCLEAAGYQVSFILPIRSPLEVAGSLNRRNGMPIAVAILLWLRHVLEAEKITRSTHRRILLWSAFMRDWRAELEKIERAISWKAEISVTGAQAVDDFLSLDLQHQVVPDNVLSMDPEAHTWAVESYEAFASVAHDGETDKALARLDRIRAALEVSCQLYGRAYQPIQQRVAELELELALCKPTEERSASTVSTSQAGQNRETPDWLTGANPVSPSQLNTRIDAVSVAEIRGRSEQAFEAAIRSAEAQARRIRDVRMRYETDVGLSKASAI